MAIAETDNYDTAVSHCTLLPKHTNRMHQNVCWPMHRHLFVFALGCAFLLLYIMFTESQSCICQLTKEATIFDSALHSNRIMKEMTFKDLKRFAQSEFTAPPTATKEHKAEITKGLTALSDAGVNTPDDAKPFDSLHGAIADQFNEHLNTHHLMAVCCEKMKQTFSQSSFVSLQISGKLPKCECFCICRLQMQKTCLCCLNLDSCRTRTSHQLSRLIICFKRA